MIIFLRLHSYSRITSLSIDSSWSDISSSKSYSYSNEVSGESCILGDISIDSPDAWLSYKLAAGLNICSLSSYFGDESIWYSLATGRLI